MNTGTVRTAVLRCAAPLMAAWVIIVAATMAGAQPAPPPQNGESIGAEQQGQPSEPANGAPAPPDQPIIAGVDLDAPLAWKADLDRIEGALGQDFVRSRQLNDLRQDLDGKRAAIARFIADLRPRLDAASAQVDKLGPAPGEGQPPEPETVARQRANLGAMVAALRGAINTAEALSVRADQLANVMQERRRHQFTERLFQRVSSPLSPELWREVIGELPGSAGRLWGLVSGWFARLPASALLLILAAFGLWAALARIARRGVDHFRTWPGPDEPPFWRRTASAAWVTLLRAAPAITAAGLLYAGLSLTGALSGIMAQLVFATLVAVIIVTTVGALITTLLAPNRPHWRIFPASDAAAIRLRRLVIALAAVFGAEVLLNTVSEVVNAMFTVQVAQSFIASAAIAGLIIAIVRTPMGERDLPDAPSFGWLRYFRIPLWLVALVILGAAVTGYVAFARFLASQLIVTGTIVAIVYLLLIWADSFGRSIADEAAAGGWLKARFGFEQRRREQIALPVTLALKAAMVIAAVPLVLLQWGFDWQDVRHWLGSAFFGFQIGDIRISLAAILAALLVFLVGYLGAKLFQRWLDSRVLGPAGLTGGARDSIRIGVGYLGVIVAALLALSYAGVDFSNIAIVAGALSVGIGFGLQSIVNNFVSGLILLVERPIKVGDRILAAGEEGIVKRISVRATEIETFDRQNVVIPNSVLIAEKVKNWTLHNAIGRLVIPVGVAYDSDPDAVCGLLLASARSHPQVMSDPEPFVLFADFGASSLDFILYVYVYDVSRSISVQTDLRIGILKAFREAGIDIPYPQTDLHLRDADWLRQAVTAQLAGGRDNGAAPRPARNQGDGPLETEN